MADQKPSGTLPLGDADEVKIKEVKKRASRRNFLSKTLFASLGLVATGAAAKKVSDIVVKSSSGHNDRVYLSRGDSVLSNRDYLLMTDEEKKELVSSLVDNYKRQA